MKIHIHTPSFFPKLVGMTYAAHTRASLLQDLGADVTVVAPGNEQDLISEVGSYQVQRFDIAGSGLPWSRLRGEVDQVVRFTARERPELVIVEGWFTPGAALLARLAPFARHLVLASHGAADLAIERLHPAHVARSLAYRWEESTKSRALMRLLSAAIVLSAYEDRLRFRDVAQFRRNRVPLYICPNSSTYTPTQGHKLPGDRIDLIHIGEMKPHKNPKCAVHTLAGLPPKFHLTLTYPEPTDHLREVLALAEANGVRTRLHLLVGRKRSELESELERADLLLITSPSKDVQPIVAVDALAKGVPFVSTDVGCMREFEGGIVAAPHDLARSILDICKDAETYRRYSEQGCRYRDRVLSPSVARNSLAQVLTDMSSLPCNR